MSKWLITKALKNTKSKTIAKWFVDDVILQHGAIDRVLTDNARYFCSEFFEDVMKLISSKHVTTTPYNPQCNGNAEKSCGTVRRMLMHYLNPMKNDWDEYLPKVTFTYNTSEHRITGFTPFELLYGRTPRLPIDVSLDLPKDFKFGRRYRDTFEIVRELAKLRIQDSQKKQKEYFDKDKRDTEFEVFDYVALNTPHREVGISAKFIGQYTGPWRVKKKISPLVYVIQDEKDPRVEKTVNIRRLKPWYNSQDSESEGSQESARKTENNGDEVSEPHSTSNGKEVTHGSPEETEGEAPSNTERMMQSGTATNVPDLMKQSGTATEEPEHLPKQQRKQKKTRNDVKNQNTAESNKDLSFM